jgi:hypothetical protein
MVVLGAVSLCWLPIAAQAAHPLQTEDTATQGAGNVEIENGAARTRTGGASSADFAAQVQFSLGLKPEIDLLVQPSWLKQGSGAERQAGLGDTNLDAKWRFFGDAPWSLALRAGVTLPTSQRGLGLPHGSTSAHAILVTTWDAAPFTAHANVGYARWPLASGLRRDARHVSGALMWAADESLTFAAEVAAATDIDPHRARWPAHALVGVIWTLQPGLDLDIGYQASVRTQPVSRSLLLGLTWRFAP